MDRPYEYLEHTADLRFRSYGESFTQALANAADCLAHAVHPDEKAGAPTQTQKKSYGYSDLEELVHDFLSDQLYMMQTEGLKPTGYSLSLDREGKKMDSEVAYHKTGKPIELEVKAVTYHGMSIRHEDGVWSIEVLCDI